MRMMTWLCGLLLLALSSFAGAETLIYTTYYHNDHLGSPVAATSEQGLILWRTQYRPYGERQGAANQDNQRAIGYTGHVQDVDSGLVYMRARYYDPLVGRFMAVDPQAVSAGAPGSFNRYAYVQGNPYRLKDPNGKWAEDLLIGVPSLAFGAYSFHQNMSEGNWGAAALDAAGMTADAVAIALPGVPGGAGLAIKAGRGVDKLARAEKVESVVDTVRGAESAAQGARLAKQLAAEQAAGVRIPTKISGYTEHGLNQAISRDGVGVSSSAVLDAWRKPLNISFVPSKYGPTFRFSGQGATVVVNAEGRVVTTWANGGSGVRAQ